MSEIRIQINVSSGGHQPNADRLARADRYIGHAKAAIDTRQRDALFDEADRIYREEGMTHE